MLRVRRRLLAPAAVALAIALAPATASADEVDDLIAVVDEKPAGMNEETWKEERRDAAKQLGKLGDTRAVPALIRVVETESFDVVAEYAIESLGKLGDDRAVPVLRQVAGDSSRDRYARELARKALRKLGASADGGGGDDDDGGGALVGSGTGASIGSSADATIDDGPEFSGDTLGATEILTLAAGGASLTYDTVREVASLDGQVDARYRREIERTKMGYGYGGTASVAGGVIDLPGDGSASEAISFAGTGGGDARFYLADSEVYGAVEGGLGLSLSALKRAAQGNSLRETMLGVDLHLGLGVGYGRILDLGEALRLRRIEMALEESRALGRPITGDLAEKIMRAWWALRGEQGAHKRLVATVKILREAGVLLGEPDASTTYKILQILVDGQLDHRLDGFDVRLGVAESYLVRDDDRVGYDDGRIETVLVRARYGMQMRSTVQEIVGEGSARLRVLADDGVPSPWTAVAAAAWRRYVYSDAFDPIGAFEVRGEVGLSDDDNGMMSSTASRVGGGIGWIWSPSRASQFRLSADASLESGEIFLGASFEAVYGFLDVGFVGKSAYGSVK
jgi:hypothetical protein